MSTRQNHQVTAPALLLDSASLYYRSYFALPESMTAPDGFPHNAIRGFFTTLQRLVARTGADRVAACWDLNWRPAWRVELVPSYKTHRLADSDVDADVEVEPDTLGPQIGAIADLLDALGIARPGHRDFEADDVIATLASRLPGPIIVVSGDRDLVQVIDDERQVMLLYTASGGMDAWPLLDAAAATQRFGVPPDRYADFAVLRGDPSDGLPGVPGIGAKTAAGLIEAFGDLDGILAACAQPRKPLTPRLVALLQEHADAVRAASPVVHLVRDLPIADDITLPTTARDPAALAALQQEWGVTKFAVLPR